VLLVRGLVLAGFLKTVLFGSELFLYVEQSSSIVKKEREEENGQNVVLLLIYLLTFCTFIGSPCTVWSSTFGYILQSIINVRFVNQLPQFVFLRKTVLIELKGRS
jgi:hypothetical protein